jgi:uncharacterized membrane protein YfcA
MQSLDVFSVSWILASCAVLLAAFVRGVSGFGLALVLAPILLLILNSKSVVVINLILGVFSNFIVLTYGFRNVYLKGITPMAVSSLLGVPLGVWIITIIAPSTLKVLVGGVTIFFAIPLAIGFTKALAKETVAGGISGFLSGFIGTSTSLGGPPVVLFMHNQNWRKETIHSSLAAYFLFSSSCSLIGLSTSGFMDIQIAVFAASLLPALLVGIGVGMVAFRRINQSYFRVISLAIIIVAGILGIISGLGILTFSNHN